MAAVLEHPAAMSSSHLHLLPGGAPQYGGAGAWDIEAFLEEASRDLVPGVEVSDYLCFEDGTEDAVSPQQPVVALHPDVAGMNYEAESGGSDLDAGSCWGIPPEADGARKRGAGSGDGDGGGWKRKKQGGAAAAATCTRKRIGFRTKSEIDVLDDGYKWRKYGKKSVKNSPNPRNYYKCSCQGCTVKKRVERDGQDASYVLTIYEGVHNHASPSSNDARYGITGRLCGNLVASSSWQPLGGVSWPGASSGGWDASAIQFSFS